MRSSRPRRGFRTRPAHRARTARRSTPVRTALPSSLLLLELAAGSRAGLVGANQLRDAAKHALEAGQRLAQRNPARVDAVFADGIFMRAGALLDHRDRPPHAARRLEIAKQDNGVGEVG